MFLFVMAIRSNLFELSLIMRIDDHDQRFQA